MYKKGIEMLQAIWLLDFRRYDTSVYFWYVETAQIDVRLIAVQHITENIKK